MKMRKLSKVAGVGALLLWTLAAPVAQAEDPGKKACVKEARQLCPAEMKSMSRKKVEACMIAKIEKTSPACHSAMLRIKAEREANATRPGHGEG